MYIEYFFRIVGKPHKKPIGGLVNMEAYIYCYSVCTETVYFSDIGRGLTKQKLHFSFKYPTFNLNHPDQPLQTILRFRSRN